MPEDNEMTDEEKEMLKMIEAEKETETPKEAPKKDPAKPKSEKPAAKKSGFSMWTWLQEIIEYNVGMIFGDTGSGKSKTCQQIAYECAKEGKKVYYIDHEANFSKNAIKTMTDAGVTYKLMSNKDELYDLDHAKIHGFDLVIIDSVTLAVTGSWAKLDMNKRGNMLQRLQGMVYRLSQHCIEKKDCIVLITAQPTSVMGDKNTIQPLGDKVQYICKEIFYIKSPKDPEGFATSRNLIFFRSRSFKDGTHISEIKTKKFGADLDKKRMQDLLKEL